jgi:hypothetical protein
MAGDRIADASASDAPWHARLAALLAASGRHDSAASHYRCALRGLATHSDGNGPEDGAQTQRQRRQWQFELAATEAKRGERTSAIALYEDILQQEPECVEALVNLAAQLAIADAERMEEALGLCERALALRPSCGEAHYNRNMLLRRLGRQREAVKECWGYLVRDIGAEAVGEEMPKEVAREVLSFEGQTQATNTDTKTIRASGGDDGCNQENEDGDVAVVCVKYGTKYGAEYVNKLYNSVMRHCGALQLAFVCLTDSADGIETHGNLTILPLDAGWKGWWNKCQLFSASVSASLRAMGHSRYLYIDLDTVIVGRMAALLRWSPPPGVLALLKTDQMANEQREGGYNSSLMAWRISNEGGGGPLRFIYRFLQAHFTAVNGYIYKFDHWLEMAHPNACFLEDTFPGQIVEYRSLDDKAAAPPPSARIVCFPLLPKPHRATAPWVAQHWA